MQKVNVRSINKFGFITNVINKVVQKISCYSRLTKYFWVLLNWIYVIKLKVQNNINLFERYFLCNKLIL